MATGRDLPRTLQTFETSKRTGYAPNVADLLKHLFLTHGYFVSGLAISRKPRDTIRGEGSSMAQAVFETFPVTEEEIERLSASDSGYRFERSSNGELIVSPPSGTSSSARNFDLALQMGNWNKAHAHGIATNSEGGFVLPDGAIFAPDAAWFPKRRLEAVPKERLEKFLPLCPDVVFEVLSPSDRHPVTRTKIEVFMRNGSRLGVFIDPYKRIVEIHRCDRKLERLENPSRVTLEGTYFEGADADLTLEMTPIFDPF